MNRSSFEAELETKGVLVYTNVGDSMFPLIHPEGDIVVIKKHKFPLKKYDVPLYKRDSGQYVLHRIIKVNKDGSYVICGDNRTCREYGITDDHVIGLLYSVVRNGKEIKMTDLKCRIYARLCCYFFWPKAIYLYIRSHIFGK